MCFNWRKALLSQQNDCMVVSGHSTWTKRYPCLLYNRSMDSVFCLSCVLFASSSTSLFNKLPGFGKWYKAGDETAYQRGH